MCLSQPLAALAAIQPPQTEKKVTVYDVQKVRLCSNLSAPCARQPFVLAYMVLRPPPARGEIKGKPYRHSVLITYRSTRLLNLVCTII